MDRNIHIFVKDINGIPLNGANIKFYSGGNLLGQATSSSGRASLQVKEEEVEIQVRVIYEGEEQEANLSRNVSSYTFQYKVSVNKPFWQENLPAILGIVLILIGLILGFTFGKPTGFQKQLILITMSLGAGGLASIIPGLINVKIDLGQKLALSAAGALAVFVVVFFNQPAIFGDETEGKTPQQEIEQSN